jgi:hypothetical protein
MRRTTSSAVNNAAIAATLTRRFATMQLWLLNVCRWQGAIFPVDTRDRYLACRHSYVEALRATKALEQSRTRIGEPAADGDHDGVDTWRRITIAVEQLVNTTPTGPLH